MTEHRTPTLAPGELPAMDRSSRIPALRERFDELGIEALVVSELANVRYLTGFTGSSAVLLVRPEDAVFVTDGRYVTQSAQQLGDAGVEADIEISQEGPEVAAAAAATGIERLGLEADSVSWSSQRRWSSELYAGELVATSGAVEALRLAKQPEEIVRIRSACAIADEALAETAALLAEGPTERDFAIELEAAMMRRGADDLSFDTIVAAGPNGARPHHQPSGRPIAAGDLVVVDFGALVDGYHSDMTRTFAVDDVGDERQRMLEVVARAQRAGVETVRAGVAAADVDAACREVIAEAGWAEAFLHGTGHGVGLDIHEEPRVSARSAATLQPGQVVTVEPGVYLPELGGVRIEDTVVVTDEGCERLTLAPKDPSPRAGG
ncbi:MAG: Xaa-Pro peptidase family protein [Microthrixaceae bacterium]